MNHGSWIVNRGPARPTPPPPGGGALVLAARSRQQRDWALRARCPRERGSPGHPARASSRSPQNVLRSSFLVPDRTPVQKGRRSLHEQHRRAQPRNSQARRSRAVGRHRRARSPGLQEPVADGRSSENRRHDDPLGTPQLHEVRGFRFPSRYRGYPHRLKTWDSSLRGVVPSRNTRGA